MDSDLLRMAEGIIYDYHPLDRDGDVEVVERPDLLMWTRPGPNKWSSSVRVTRWAAEEADQRIEDVLAFFMARGRSFVWHVVPSATPTDLGPRLEGAGLTREPATRLLVGDLPIRDLRANDEVRIVDARTSAQVEAKLRFAWPDWSDETIRSETADRLRSLDLYGERAGHLLAYLGGKAVADASWRDSTDGRAIYLTGGGTRPEHRGKAIYQTLTAYRLDRALARGCRYAVIQARTDTSMPILLRRGFRDVGETVVYSWAPGSGSG